MRALDVGIVGCGYAGASAALFLERAGHAVTIYEEVAEPRAIGAGIVLQPTGMYVLDRLGLLDPVFARGAPLDGLVCRTATGRLLVDLAYRDLAPGLFGLGLHRGALFEVLLEAVRASKARLVCGASITRLESGAARARLFNANGASAGDHELVIVANGARSALRDATGLVRRARAYPWGALWFVARDPERIFERRLEQVASGTQRFVGFLPTGFGPASARESVPLLSLFYSVRMDRVGALFSAGLDAFKREVLSYEPRARPLLEQIESMDQLLPASYLDVVLARWQIERIVFIGDAAHATSPQLGQGCNLALWDAMVLAECLSEDAPLERALASYDARRRAHLSFYQRMTRYLTPFFQSDRRLFGLLRDLFMGQAASFLPIRREMIRTMAGIKTGLIGRSLPLEPILRALPEPPRAALPEPQSLTAGATRGS